MRNALLLCFFGCTAGWAAGPTDLEFTLASSLPDELVEYLRVTRGHEAYALASWVNPYYLQADFNGDGRSDVAVLVRDKATDKRGVLVVHVGAKQHFVLGAGHSIGNGGDDFSWMDAWHTQARQAVAPEASDGRRAPALLGDALTVMKTESASGLIYWTGTEYAWRQQGD